MPRDDPPTPGKRALGTIVATPAEAAVGPHAPGHGHNANTDTGEESARQPVRRLTSLVHHDMQLGRTTFLDILTAYHVARLTEADEETAFTAAWATHSS